VRAIPIGFRSIIADRTRDFVGREWVFAEIDRWLADPEGPPFFLITGEPGIGKSAIAARLTQVRDLAAYHFCIARQAPTTDARTFVRSLSLQLAQYCQPFARALAQVGNAQISIQVSQTVNHIASGGEVNGVVIQNLDLGQTGVREAFVLTILEPLWAVGSSGWQQPLVIVVDALDEAVLEGSETIVDLLADAGTLPRQVRFILTTRPEESVLQHFEHHQIPYFPLDASRPENRRYAWQKTGWRKGPSSSE
jgi:hypothetical protein